MDSFWRNYWITSQVKSQLVKINLFSHLHDKNPLTIVAFQFVTVVTILLSLVVFQIYSVTTINEGNTVAWWVHIGSFITCMFLIIPMKHRHIKLFDPLV
jgi:Ni,Fe-hydrogenase I cytochrome b subunit